MINMLKKGNNEGFSIIEVMFGLVIFAFGILALGVLHMASMKGNASARQMTEASELAMERFEQFSTETPYDEIQDKADEVVNGFNTTYNIAYNYIENVTQEVKTVTITLTWTDNLQQNRTLTMQHIIPSVNR